MLRGCCWLSRGMSVKRNDAQTPSGGRSPPLPKLTIPQVEFSSDKWFGTTSSNLSYHMPCLCVAEPKVDPNCGPPQPLWLPFYAELRPWSALHSPYEVLDTHVKELMGFVSSNEK